MYVCLYVCMFVNRHNIKQNLCAITTGCLKLVNFIRLFCLQKKNIKCFAIQKKPFALSSTLFYCCQVSFTFMHASNHSLTHSSIQLNVSHNDWRLSFGR